MSLMSKAPKIVPRLRLFNAYEDECGKEGEAKQKSVFLDICESN